MVEWNCQILDAGVHLSKIRKLSRLNILEAGTLTKQFLKMTNQSEGPKDFKLPLTIV
jgi:hypothetical protein